MTTLYRPVLITSAEQAEALPEDAIVIGVETGERYTRAFEGDWWGVTEMGNHLAVDLDAGYAVTALVPVEAEEECQDIDAYEASGHMRRHHLARYTTPWEDVS